MNIESLKYFSEVAMLKSISKVAVKSHISQPALSNQLAKLEEEFGVKLFERSNKGVILTEYGEIVLNFSNDILKDYDNLTREIQQRKNKQSNIKIGIMNLEANILFSKFFNAISYLFEDLGIVISTNYNEDEQVLLINNKFDAIVSRNCIRDNDLCSKYIGSDKFVFVSKSKINKENIKDIQFILYDCELLDKDIFNEILDKNIKIKTNSLNIIKAYIENKNVVAFLPKIMVEEEIKKGELMEFNYYNEDMIYNFYIIYKYNLDTNIRKKIEYLSLWLEEQIKYLY